MAGPPGLHGKPKEDKQLDAIYEQIRHNQNKIQIFTNNLRCSYRTHKAGVMPCVAKSLNKLVPSLHWKIAAMALSAEESNVI